MNRSTNVCSALLSCLIAMTACKSDKDSEKAAGDKPVEATPAAATTPDTPASATSPGAAEVDFKKFVTDKMTVADLSTVYPAGQPFTMRAKLKDAPACEAECTVTLSDGDKTFNQFMLPAENKPKLEGKKAGDEIVLACAPVYEGGMMQSIKSCNVQ